MITIVVCKSLRGAAPEYLGILHRRRLVINIGRQKFGSQILGGQNFGEIYFKTKNLEKVKSSLLFSQKFLTTFFLVIDNFFTKCTPFIQNVLRFSA